MNQKKKVTVITLGLLALIIAAVLLYPTVMELTHDSGRLWTHDEILRASTSLRDGNFANGEIMDGQVRYILFFGDSFEITSLVS